MQRVILFHLGGSGEIRTHEGRKPSTVFKTVAFNRSATLPSLKMRILANFGVAAKCFLHFKCA